MGDSRNHSNIPLQLDDKQTWTLNEDFKLMKQIYESFY